MQTVVLSPIRLLRLHSGLTQKQLAARIDRSHGWLSLAERGFLTPSPGDVEALAVELGVSPEILALAEACDVAV